VESGNRGTIMNHQITAALLAAAAALSMQAASAADIPVKAVPAPPPAIASGLFGYIEGMYVQEPSSHAGQYPNALPFTSSRATPGDGWGGAFLVGYRFAGPWDLAAGMHQTRFSDGDLEPFPACGPLAFAQMTNGRIWSAQGNVGYNFASDNSTTRMFLGVRYAQWKHNLSDTCNARANVARTRAIGPHGGFEHAFGIFSNTRLIVGADASVLFAEVEDTVRTVPAGVLIGTNQNDRIVFQAGAHGALSWNVTPLVALSLGYKIQTWVGMLSEAAGFSATSIGTGKSNVIEHGPFVRASYNFGVR
jgi:opacity protein-like surface antigen